MRHTIRFCLAVSVAYFLGAGCDQVELLPGDDAGGSLIEDSGALDSGHLGRDAAVEDAAAAMDSGDGAATDDAGADASVDASSETDAETDADVDMPAVFGGLTVDSDPEAQSIDLFGHAGHRFWIEVTDEQVQAINNGNQGGGGGGDIYSPGQGAGSGTFADHIVVQDVVTKSVADYGKMEVKIIGGSTYRPWTETTIPNVRIDADEFHSDASIGGFEHLRLNNAIVGNIFREHLVFSVFRALGYPSPRSTYAFFGNPVWGDDVWVPMILVEVYKKKFCDDNAAAIGGTCDNMFEFYGDPAQYTGNQVFPAEYCQTHPCDGKRINEFADALAVAPTGSGFRKAMAPYVDWQRFHEFQCISWMLEIQDDALHAGNNVMMYEREDGKLLFGPYSVDISMGNFGGSGLPLTAEMTLARRCQQHHGCWADTIAVCEQLVQQFDDLNPEEILDANVALLEGQGMLRDGDQQRAEELRAWLVNRQLGLRDALETYRYLPDENGNCPMQLDRCNDGSCGTPEQCELRKCGQGQVWCEGIGQCIWGGEDCPSCEGDYPFWCPVVGQCVAGQSTCDNYCEQYYGQNYLWCPPYSDCRPDYACPTGNDEDAGVDADGGLGFYDAGAPLFGGGMFGGGGPIKIE